MLVSVELNEDWIAVLYEFNPLFNNIVKEVAGAKNWKFDGNDKKWKIKPLVDEKVLNELSNAGADISGCIEYITENISEIDIKSTMEAPSLNVISKNKKTLDCISIQLRYSQRNTNIRVL